MSTIFPLHGTALEETVRQVNRWLKHFTAAAEALNITGKVRVSMTIIRDGRCVYDRDGVEFDRARAVVRQHVETAREMRSTSFEVTVSPTFPALTANAADN